MSEWLDVASARSAKGLRLVLTVGVPGPWGEAAKGLFQAKKFPYQPVRQLPAQPNEELRDWTGEINAPQAIFEDEPARNRWNDLILLAERIAPTPSLLPSDPAERALMFGLVHEIAGEQGFGWSKRLMALEPVMNIPGAAENPALAGMVTMARRYGYDERAAAAAPERAAAVLRVLGEQLRAQRAAGRRYLVGDALSALDIYWAAFAALVDPLPHDVCPMPEPMRKSYAAGHPLLDEALDPALLEHRDAVYAEHLVLPIDLGL